jgi:glycosyl hydrolase family 39 (putative alpha-L-iduronidase)
MISRAISSIVLAAVLFTAPSVEACLPALNSANRGPIPAEFFGMHFHHIGSTTPWPNVPIQQWRLWDAYVAWPNLEPAKGQWRFQTLDKYVAIASEHNVGLLLPLGLSPGWASARPQEKSTYQPGGAAEPRDIEDWRTYVGTVARRYKGKIQAYEIWNEPNLKQFYSGTVDQMVTLTREASQIIRQIDPNALIVSPSATQDRGVPWLAEFLLKGGGAFVDVIGFHFYVAPQPPEATVPLVSSVRQTMVQSGVGEKPVWNTEAGWFLPKPFPEDLAAAYVVRDYILNWVAGVQRLYWYAWDNHGWVSLETTQKDSSTLTSAGAAYAVAVRWLSGARILSCNNDSKQRWTCELERGGHKQWILWSAAGPSSYHLSPEWRINRREEISGSNDSITTGDINLGPSPVLLESAAQ